LDAEDAGDFDVAAFEVAVLVAAVGFGRVATLLLAVRFTVRDDLPVVFADFDFSLLVAMWLSPRASMTASCAATATAPPIRRGKDGERNRTLFAGQPI
jgi:hypothetical protein